MKPFIQNVHHFRDVGVNNPNDPPADHVVIFDEAQRAWNLDRTSRFMRERKGISGFNQSEPEFLISYMDRHPDWPVIVCLVGGGQEINTGEAGISAWLDAVREKFPHWDVHISPDLHDSEYAAGQALEALGSSVAVATEPSLLPRVRLGERAEGGASAYLLNANRVLLTRARQGMVIFVPEGDAEDSTRRKEFYDATSATCNR